MNKMQKGALIVTVTAGILFGVSREAVAIVQAPTQSTFSMEVTTDHDGKEVTLFANSVYRQEEDTGEEQIKEKIDSLEERRSVRVQEEKEEERRLRKKRLEEKKKRKEEKRRKEIAACCGVSAGSEDRRILERIVEAEAGGEDLHGRLLVANVVLNRVKSKSFPSTIRGVVFSHRGSRYQFSPISDGRYYSVRVSSGTRKAVSLALHGKDPSEGALYFMERAYANHSNARWFDRELTRLFQYGCHEFFR